MGRLWSALSSPRGVIIVTLTIVYATLMGGRLRGPSADNHFAYLAQSWLAGSLHMTAPPPHGNDWASYEVLSIEPSSSQPTISELRGVQRGGLFITLKGEPYQLRELEVLERTRRYFVSFPPLPAVVMLPLVWLQGVSASDTWVTLLFAILNGVFCYGLLSEVRRRGWLRAPSPDVELWLVALMCLGGAHLWCAILGQVWYTALIMGVCFQLLYLRASLDTKQPIRAGFWLALAFATRPSLVILSLIFYGQLLFSRADGLAFKERLRRLCLFSTPPLVMGVALMWHNYVRFESVFEFGHSYLAGGNLKRITEYGLFHWVFIKKNLIAAFALLPMMSVSSPYLTLSMHGMAVQFSSPGLLWSLGGIAHKHQVAAARMIQRLGSISAAFIFMLLISYQNTGWVQYSWRFILDLTPLLTLLIALSCVRLSAYFKGAVIWGIIVNAVGAVTFGRSGEWFEFVNLPQLLPH